MAKLMNLVGNTCNICGKQIVENEMNVYAKYEGDIYCACSECYKKIKPFVKRCVVNKRSKGDK